MIDYPDYELLKFDMINLLSPRKGADVGFRKKGIVKTIYNSKFSAEKTRSKHIIQFHFGKLKVKVVTALSWSYFFVFVVCLFLSCFLTFFSHFTISNYSLSATLETK